LNRVYIDSSAFELLDLATCGVSPDSSGSLLSSPLQAQRKELFIQERYSRYNLSDPFQALQRDSEAVGDQNKDPGCSSSTSNPLVVLKLVVSHCRRMQEKMLAQLAAAESRHRRVGVCVSTRGMRWFLMQFKINK